MKNDRLNARGNVRRYMAERMSENMPDRMQERYDMQEKYGGNNFKTYVKTPRNHGRQVWHEHIFVTVVISEVSYLFAVFLHVFSSSSPICRGCIRKRLVFRSILWHESNKIWRCFFLSGFSVHVFGSAFSRYRPALILAISGGFAMITHRAGIVCSR